MNIRRHAIIAMFFVPGCGSQLPISTISADAGGDAVASPRDTVILDGTASEGDGISFLWEQASGQPVELLDASSAVAVFDAPDTGAVLVFTLTVSLGDMSDLDVVTVIVEDDEEMVCLFYQGDGSDTHLLILDWDGDEERSPYGFGPTSRSRRSTSPDIRCRTAARWPTIPAALSRMSWRMSKPT